MEDMKFEESSGNVFADLELSEPDERLAKADLAAMITQIINKRHLSQSQAAELLKISQPKVSMIMNCRLKGFSMEKMMILMMALNRDIEILVKLKPNKQEHGRLRVVYA